MAIRQITLSTEELRLLDAILQCDSRRNALPIAIEKGYNVSQYVNLAEKIDELFQSSYKEDLYVEARQK